MRWLDPATVRYIHDEILEPGQLQGESTERTIEAALERVRQQAHYGRIDPTDVLQIAAAYAVPISRAHAFNDGNKRTALMAMLVFLDDHGYALEVDDERLAVLMEDAAANRMTDEDLYSTIFEHLVKLTG